MALTTAKKKKQNASTRQPQVLTAENLARYRWLLHGWSTRQGGGSDIHGKGSLNLGFTAQDKKETILQNRRIFLESLGAQKNKKLFPFVTLRQIHSSYIHLVERPFSEPPAGDGMITNKRGLVLGIQTADCLPILIADPVNKAIGAFHAGWRGTLARIVEKGVGAMRMHFGSDPAWLLAAIGPGIGGCCYNVGAEVQAEFESQFDYAQDLFHSVFESDPVRERYPLLFMTARAPGHSDLGPQLHLDLVKANRMQLVRAGLKEENISASKLCTACNVKLLFSYRAEHGKTGRMMAAIGIKP
ncbi:MAG TPA: peptidoglycan editing factor PgeF [Terriglobales bacterium]|jgi:YfiH family protein|nr:peptidoglycan editing factor PgeF [Terriglobales bacterium]